MKPSVALVTVVVVLAMLLPVQSSAKPAAHSYLVIASGATLPAHLSKSVAASGGTLTRAIPEIGIAVATSSDATFMAKAAGIAGVQTVVPNPTRHWIDSSEAVTLDAVGIPPASGEDDTLFDLQWGHDAIDAPEAWAAGSRGAGVRVAVLDNGIDADHPDLTANLNVALSTSFIPGETFEYSIPNDPANHGSGVAGTIAAADNGLGTIGVAPEAELVMVKVVSSLTGDAPLDGILQGIVYAASIDADVINMSIGDELPKSGGCETNPDTGDEVCISASEAAAITNAVGRATTYAYLQGSTLIASAGNHAIDGDHDRDLIHLPSQAPFVIAVAATAPIGWGIDPTTNLDVPTVYTNYGQSVIDVAAPGGTVDDTLAASGQICTVAGLTERCAYFDLVFSTAGADSWSWWIGTSFAAPHVAGVAALIIGHHGGALHPAQVESILRASVDDLGKPGNDDYFGAGRVNAANAVE
jgi:subtilisin family serine protease